MKANYQTKIVSPSSEIADLRSGFLSLVRTLIEIDLMVSDAMPHIYKSLPRGQRWEVSDELERFELQLDSAIGNMESWIAAKPWKDRCEISAIVRSIRKAGTAARDAAEKLEEHEIQGYTKIVSVLRMLARYHKAVAGSGDRFAKALSNAAGRCDDPYDTMPIHLDSQAIAALLK